MSKILSIDVGNSKLKMIGSNGVRTEIPNVVATASELREVREMEKSTLDSLHVKITAQDFGTACFVIGKLAAEQPFASELNLISEKSNNKQSLIMLLTAAALDAVADNTLFNHQTNTYVAKYNLSIGLPVSQNSLEAKRELTALLKKKYYLEFLNTKDIAGKKVELYFSNIQINTEAIAAYATLLTKNPALSQTHVMLYDIGGLTNDVTVILNNQVNNAHSNSFKDGMAVVLDSIKHKLASKYNYCLNSRQQVIDLLLKGKDAWKISVFGEKIDVSELIDFELKQYSNKIIRQIEALWFEIPSVECCYFMGGGSVLLNNYLLESMDTLGMKMSLKFIDSTTAVWANVEGYSIIANKIFMKPAEEENKWSLMQEGM